MEERTTTLTEKSPAQAPQPAAGPQAVEQFDEEGRLLLRCTLVDGELEGALGEILFVRLPGRLKPTERAQALYASVAPMKMAVLEAGRLFAEAGAQVA
ncbi:MAG: hypothetical protein ACOVK6_13805, partial [Ramlibacter sp.]